MRIIKKKYSRFLTRVVNIGDVPLGGNYPIRIQSMTTTNTLDTNGTVEQAIRIINAGADYIRITAPSLKDAANLEDIKKQLRAKGYNTPIIADIHYTPNAAELAARIVEKVRINPGNYADKKKFQFKEYTDIQYQEELERIAERFTPLVKICKEYGTAMRIGVNHGSLSDRIMSRYGDTPLGMVESAMEFVKICEANNFYDIVLSMKSSNPQVMIAAYRLLVEYMLEHNMNYPLHLGVTEAGDGIDGRAKSAIGIGTLLEDGYGDTIRVSLTEEPEFEIPVCKSILKRYENKTSESLSENDYHTSINYKTIEPRKSITVLNIGGGSLPIVVLTLQQFNYEVLKTLGYYYNETMDKWNLGFGVPDYIYLRESAVNMKLPGTLRVICDLEYYLKSNLKENFVPLCNVDEYENTVIGNNVYKFLLIKSLPAEKIVQDLTVDYNTIIVLETNVDFLEIRNLILTLRDRGIKCPLIIKKSINNDISKDDFIVNVSIDFGGLLIDRLIDGIWIESDTASPSVLNQMAFDILQATRTRISKTEYIACPSCGRTLFDLQKTTNLVRSKTNHLKGLKIAIMGCIVNGPGEMADADYGYVGSGIGKVTLYKKKDVVKRNIDSDKAVDELIKLIKENGDWVDPS
ncbi:MAG: (E)-4-hydroxy-3-methylbut-2-enyl-diphosphate synthase [Ignavibacteria bacterium]